MIFRNESKFFASNEKCSDSVHTNDLKICLAYKDNNPVLWDFRKKMFQPYNKSQYRRIENSIPYDFPIISETRHIFVSSFCKLTRFNKYSSFQVDASKAPGYRGTTSMSSPVSSKTQLGSSNNSAVGNAIGSGVSTAVMHNTIQPSQFQSSVAYNDHPHPSNKPPGSLAVARPVMSQQNLDMSQYNRPVYPSEIGPRNTGSHQQHVMQPPSSQSNLDVGLFKTNNSGYDHPNANLLKMVPGEAQQGHPMMPYHPHMQSFAQTMGGQSPSVNTTVSMSRLNPRAPDFSSSLHLNSKPVTMLNSMQCHHQNMYGNVQNQPPPSAMQQSNNLGMLGNNYTMGKYQQSAPSGSRGSGPGMNSSNGQARWPFPHNNLPPHQDPMIGQIGGFPNHLGSMAGQSSNIDLITSLENGSSPAMSPSSPAQVAQEMNQLKIEDRKQPRPIGTERAWKNYTSTLGPGGDADAINWMLTNEKQINSWATVNVPPTMDRPPMYRPSTSYNRMTHLDTELHQMMDSNFQVSIRKFLKIFS